jgi:3',5'-cyclic AMP phosphodiesterase CpdA
MNILHLSDLHFGTKEDADRWYTQLEEDLSKHLKCNSLDALIISGDIASTSVPQEYEAAKEFIINLMIDFRLRWSEVVIVPGNHDLNLAIAKDAYKPTLREEYHGLRDESHIIDKGEEDTIKVLDPEKYKQRFTYFRAFYNTFLKKPYSLEPEWQYTLHPFPNHDLLILGLNSAWQLDHYYTFRVSINPDALSHAMAEIDNNPTYKKSRLKIAVWHHPLNSSFKDRITDHNFLEQLAQNGFRLALHGHIHQGNKENFKQVKEYPPDKQIDIVAAGIFGNRISEQELGSPWQYNLLKWEGKKLTVYTRKRTELYGAWQPDAMWVSSDGITASSYYEIELFPLKTPPLPSYVKEHCEDLSKDIMKGLVVPFLGADINLCDRPPKEKDSKPSGWKEDGLYPPTNLELAAYIDRETTSIGKGCGYLQTVRCPLISGTSLDALPTGLPPECPLITGRITRLDLDRVSQYFQSKESSSGKLKDSINAIYHQSSYQFNSLHKFLVRLIKEVYSPEADTGNLGAIPYPLIVTTCFDRTLERAFENELLPFDLVSYTSSKKQFIHQRFDPKNDSKNKLIDIGEIVDRTDTTPEWFKHRPVILRLYGPVDWNNNQKGENFAMTEDHFLDYLACDISHRLPTKLWNKLLEGRLWFLGYSLSYWNLRFIIRQIRKDSETKWWAVQEKADILDRDLWKKDNSVTFYSDREIGSLEQYLKEIDERLTDELQKLPKPPARR